MNPYQLLIPQLLAGAVIVILALRAVRAARKEAGEHERRLANRMAEHRRYITDLKSLSAAASQPSVLRITLDLIDPSSIVDIGGLTRDAENLIRGLNDYDIALGGCGLILVGARSDAGRVVLTLSPRDMAGASERVRRIAEALNAAFDTEEAQLDEAPPFLDTLPKDVSTAHATTLAA